MSIITDLDNLDALLERCKAGDQLANTELYEHYAPAVYRLSYSILLHQQDAEDVVQEVFVYVFRSLHRYDPERGAFRTWLYTITVSRCRNARRRKILPTVALGELLATGLEPSGPESDNPERISTRNDVERVLKQALTTLSPRLREAIALRYGQGLTYREMGAILNIPPKTAESRIRLAHQALRKAVSSSDAAMLKEVLES
jgi:RNA polymerase sigma-70 factor (ECF subfamily)